MERSFSRLAFVGLLTLACLVRLEAARAGQWVELSAAEDTGVVYHDVVCPDANHCWIVGSNQGQAIALHADPSLRPVQFVEVGLPSSPIVPPALRRVHFLDATRGWAVGQAECVLGYESGAWTVLKHSGTENLSAVFFFNASEGFIISDQVTTQNYLWYSSDGGSSWSAPRMTPFGFLPQAAWFRDAASGVLAGVRGVGAETLQTTDSGGVSWFPASGANVDDLHSLVEAPDGRLWAPGINDRLMVANSSDFVFSSSSTGLGATWRDIAFAQGDAQLVWLVGDNGATAFSDDGGSNWTGQSLAASLELQAVSAIDRTHAFAVAWDGARGGVILSYACTLAQDCATDDLCLSNPTCNAGVCEYDATDCEDGDPCTDNYCDSLLGCLQDFNTAPCDDGDLCTFDDACDGAGACVGTPISCDDDPATCGARRSCDGSSNCAETYPDSSTSCDDGELCTFDDACDGAGACLGTPISCDDEPTTCGARRSCDGSPNCAETYPDSSTSCDDGDLCTFDDACDGAGACVGTPIICDDDPTTCGARRSCDGSSQCIEIYPEAGSPCDDGEPCTTGDACDGLGQCRGQPYDCDDEDPCTEDICDGQGACSHQPSTAGTRCGLCRICSAEGRCVQAQAGAACQGPDECSPDGQCDASGVCLVEAPCSKPFRPGCPILVSYGKDEGQRTDCRLPAETIQAHASVLPAEPGGAGYIPVRLSLRNTGELPLWDLSLSLSLPASNRCSFVPGSLEIRLAKRALKPNLRFDPAGESLLIRLPDTQALRNDEDQILLVDFLLQGKSIDWDPQAPRLALDVWAPCASEIDPTESHSLGCHHGLAGDGQHDLMFQSSTDEAWPLQSVSSRLLFQSRPGEYRQTAEPQDAAETGSGCSCGASWPDSNFVFLFIMGAWWAWRRQKRSPI